MRYLQGTSQLQVCRFVYVLSRNNKWETENPYSKSRSDY